EKGHSLEKAAQLVQRDIGTLEVEAKRLDELAPDALEDELRGRLERLESRVSELRRSLPASLTIARLRTAVGLLARLARRRATGRGATALPGLVALTLDPDYIGALSSELPHGVVCVSGTNGKTTTARMLADMTRTAGWQPIHNRSGSNLDRGVAAALLADATWSAEPRGGIGLFEIDQASLPRAVARVRPRL